MRRDPNRVIWKFQFAVADDVSIEMPAFAEILHVDVQNDVPAIWAIVDPRREVETRKFHLYGTGHAMCVGDGTAEHSTPAQSEAHIGSFMLRNGQLVFHLFEVPSWLR